MTDTEKKMRTDWSSYLNLTSMLERETVVTNHTQTSGSKLSICGDELGNDGPVTGCPLTQLVSF